MPEGEGEPALRFEDVVPSESDSSERYSITEEELTYLERTSHEMARSAFFCGVFVGIGIYMLVSWLLR